MKERISSLPGSDCDCDCDCDNVGNGNFKGFVMEANAKLGLRISLSSDPYQ